MFVHVCVYQSFRYPAQLQLNHSRTVLFFIGLGRGVYCPHSCVCDVVRKHTVFNGNPLPSRIFSSECVGGCCADVRDRQIEGRERGREGEK